MMRFCCSVKLLCLVASIATVHLNAQSSEAVPAIQRELRATWVTSVYNLDWPSKVGLSEKKQKQELIELLDNCQHLNLNAIFLQVRPEGDALYNSKLEPWSHWLTGKMGKSPGYDPLAFCIAEAHRRGIEVHAWINPFRALTDISRKVNSKHFSLRKDLVFKKVGNKLWLDPSYVGNRRWVVDVIDDIVSRYNIDGVHMDDYFYPYPSFDEDKNIKDPFPDKVEHQRYLSAGGDKDIEAWRRENIDIFIQSVAAKIKARKPWVRFGISPFGIWRPGVPAGTDAQVSSYDHLACDSLKWAKEGWVDYLTPQLYWAIDSEQSFYKLMQWWAIQSNVPIWPGLDVDRIFSKKEPSRNAEEILEQVILSRQLGMKYQQSQGQAFWRSSAVLGNKDKVANKLKRYFYAQKALLPPLNTSFKPQAPKSPQVNLVKNSKGWELTCVLNSHRAVVQFKLQGRWQQLNTLYGNIKLNFNEKPEIIIATPVGIYGHLGEPTVVK